LSSHYFCFFCFGSSPLLFCTLPYACALISPYYFFHVPLRFALLLLHIFLHIFALLFHISLVWTRCIIHLLSSLCPVLLIAHSGSLSHRPFVFRIFHSDSLICWSLCWSLVPLLYIINFSSYVGPRPRYQALSLTDWQTYWINIYYSSCFILLFHVSLAQIERSKYQMFSSMVEET
jgi:hypothetical protein